MRAVLARHGSTIVVAAIVAALTAAAPSIAASAKSKLTRNSDRVDGIHATTAKKARALKQRRGKLVATDTKTGKLPKQVIPVLGTAQINESKLRKVPGAARADSAARADTAGHAATAGAATTAGTATSASRAGIADMAANSLGLGGFSANELTQTWAKKIPTTGDRTARITMTAPREGLVIMNASCTFRMGGAAGDRIVTLTAFRTGASYTDPFQSYGSVPDDETNLTVTATHPYRVTAGEEYTFGAQVSAPACANSFLIVTYTANGTISY